ncbi:MAG: hypothetical protein V4576_03520 [Patescibacteria group bacterium]
MWQFNNIKSILFGLALMSVGSVAQSTHAQIYNNPTEDQIEASFEQSITQTAVNSKGQTAAYDKKAQSGNTKVDAAPVFSDAASCVADELLKTIMTSAISSAVQKGVGTAVNTVAGLLHVPTEESGQVLLNSNSQANAEVGTTIGAFGIGAITAPGWNAVGYCIVNAMITYVANSTIAWVQGGFEGNPSFVNNPEQFFKELADVEASAFLKQLAYGTLGLNICEPFRAQIVLTIARSHVSGQQGYGGPGGYSQGGYGGANGANGGRGGNMAYGGCSLDDIKGNMQGFLNGDFQRGGWDSWFQVSQIDTNNPYSTYFNLQAQLDGAISKKQTIAAQELDWGKGFLSFRKCAENTPKDKQKDCPITTPGIIIQGQLEKTLGLAKDRLVLAEKFDQVVSAVVNELINVALDKVLEQKEKK